MSTVLEQKCPSCGAMMRFDPQKQKLVCDYCDKELPFDATAIQSEEITKGFNFESIRQGYAVPDAQALPIYLCKSCGAELIAPPEQFAMTCPYCRNNVVLTDKASGNLRPNGILPFRITADALPGLLQEFYKDKKLLPKDFFSESTMAGVTGVYVPFWLFSGDLRGSASFIGHTVTTSRQGDYEVTTTSYYEFENIVSLDFRDLPVDASNRIDDALMDSLEPFHLEDVQPFDVGYLAGFTADRFDVPSKDMEARAKQRIENTADGILASKNTPYIGSRRISGHLDTHLTAKYCLLPVYLFHISYGGKKYPFAVNGQTGKIVGSVPTAKDVSMMYFLKRAGIVAGAIIGFFAAKYFLGA